MSKETSPITALLEAYLVFQNAKAAEAVKSGKITLDDYLFEMYTAILPNMVEVLHMPLGVASTALTLVHHTVYTDPKYAEIVECVERFEQSSDEKAEKWGLRQSFEHFKENLVGSLDELLKCYNNVKEAVALDEATDEATRGAEAAATTSQGGATSEV